MAPEGGSGVMGNKGPNIEVNAPAGGPEAPSPTAVRGVLHSARLSVEVLEGPFPRARGLTLGGGCCGERQRS